MTTKRTLGTIPMTTKMILGTIPMTTKRTNGLSYKKDQLPTS